MASSRSVRNAAVIAAGLWLAATGTAAAQTAPTGVVAYTPADFAGTAPQTAGDLLALVPGFTIVEADADVRGYAGALGNVLIDGVRPASKRQDIGDVLDRIPAASVERIELIRGGVAGVDMAGHPVVANIVRRRSAATAEGAVTAGVVAYTDGWTRPQVEAEYARAWDDRALELTFNYEPELDDETGPGVIETTEADGAVETDRLGLRTVETLAEAGATWRAPLAGGTFSAAGALRRTDVEAATRIEESDGDREEVDERETFDELELGLRYSRSLSDTLTAEVMASRQLGRLDAAEDAREDGETERFTEISDSGETIVRGDLVWEPSETLSVSAGLEGAFNFLESEARLEENGAPVDLPGSDVRIEERRVEASVAGAWKPAPGWQVEGGLRLEASTIIQTGDSPQERSFLYPKPRVAVTHELGGRDRLRLSVSREVGQLDFGDFVASASLDQDVVTAGNADLEPDKTWRTALSWDHDFGGGAALTLTWTHDEIEDVVDRILIVTPTDVFDAPGNIGDGRRDTLALELSAPLDRLGLSGGRLRSSLLWRDSEVTDPVTGERRGISDEEPFEGTIELSQDLPSLSLSWGASIDPIAERSTEYRFDEVTRASEASSWSLWVERRFGDWRLRAEVADLFGRDFTETRDKYDGPRSTTPLDEIERRRWEQPGYVSLTVRRSLGG
ncbi:TonB-dependent receptor plug domain-containing protein [Brevundimonas sp. Root1279]|uniref:TonB-dependent receptor plug domain-containing protein n=1 Tax=Brevundimonas sp. Root1279 TaxID=1736443 RepID=UPI000ABD73D0|nr:TonB-dependent receptor [Brevundimonas sp. Root1279]